MPQVCKLCKPAVRAKVLKCMEAGQSNRSIGAHFGVSPNAVQGHRKHVKALVAKVQKQVEGEGRTALQRLIAAVDEAEQKYRGAKDASLEVQWFAQWRAMLELAFKLGMEAAKEGQQYPDMTPAVAKLVERVTTSLQQVV